ncbi:MAG: ABC transporter permease [Bacteroidales bacterium]|nr:ABC transporter permease [Bacteroidales bacterium]
MKVSRLILNNLVFYWKRNFLLSLGIAISAAVLTGALIVGNSVEYSLNRIVDRRLGEVSHVLKAGDRYFTRSLGEKVGAELDLPVSSILLLEGMGVAGGGQKRINNIQIVGVDESFDRVAGLNHYYENLAGDSVIISQNLANRLGVSKGEEIVLGIKRASLIPLNAPFVSDAESMVSLRVSIKEISDADHLGRFNLKVSQTAPFNVFISSQRLADLMEFDDRSNALLLRDGTDQSEQAIWNAIRENFTLDDAGLRSRVIDELQTIEIISERVFFDDVLIDPLEKATGFQSGILTYFVNAMQSAGNTTPYSFISTLPDHTMQPDEIIINTWLSRDLSAVEGDTIHVKYFVVGPLRELSEEITSFIVKSVVPMEGIFNDVNLMPDLPGLSDAGNCRDWETGVPIKLESIRDIDEDYWKRFKGTPKAFIALSTGKELWKNRFGTFTGFRYSALETDQEELRKEILDRFDPRVLGFTLEPVMELGHTAAGEGVDFSQLFGGLSFFLLLASVILTILLFLLNLESREEQMRTLAVVGIPVKIIRRIMLWEGMLVALAGAVLGQFLAIFYNRGVFHALNGVWMDVVRTEMLEIHIRMDTLITGFAVIMGVSFLTLFFPLNRFLRRVAGRFKLQSGLNSPGMRRGVPAIVSGISGLAAIALIISQLISGEVVNTSIFFAAGGLLLLSSIFFFAWYLGGVKQKSVYGFHLKILSRRNAMRNRTRSMSIVILFAIGTFLVISTGSNRKDLFQNAEDPNSGTGGFLYFAESTLPVLQNLNDPKIRFEFGLESETSFVQLRKAAGDDASCLNLNKVINPQVLGVDPGMLDGRNSFVTRTPYLDVDQPWMSLQNELPGGLIPAIADETVIQWGLGLKVGDTLRYINSNGGIMELLLIGGLAPSIFQGNVIISNDRFLEQFPESSGTHIFLIDGEVADTALIRTELNRGMRDFGWDMQMSATRLAEFNSVTNTYLSIFLVLGALGLLLGTFGLVVVLSRSMLERRQEIALLKAVGYSRKSIRRLIVKEYMFLLQGGIGTGFLAAVIATLPSILSPNTDTSIITILVILLALILNGWLWIFTVTSSALKEKTIHAALRND